MQLSRKKHFQQKNNNEQLIIKPWVWICRTCQNKLFEERITLTTINKLIIIKIENLPSDIIDTDYTNYRCPKCNSLLSASILNIVPFTEIDNTSRNKIAKIEQTVYFKTSFVCFDKRNLILAREA